MTSLRVPHYLTRDEKGFWFRMFVPVHLRPIIGRTVSKKSLRTIDATLAAARAPRLAARYALAFRVVEAGRMSGDEDALKAGIKALYGGTVALFKVKNGPNGPEAEIEPHDTPQTIAAGMAGYGRALDAWEGVEIERAKSEAHVHSDAYQRALASINAPVPAPEQPASTAPLLAAAFDAYFQTGDVLGSENKDARQRATRRFVEHVGSAVRTTDVTKAMAVRWLDELQTEQTEIVGTDRHGKPVAKTVPWMSKLTARGYCGHMKMIWEWLIPRGEAEINPWDGIIKVKKSEKKQRRKEGHWRGPFDVEQLRAIFDPATFQKAGTIHARWGAVLGLYLGARVEEIAQMLVCDFGVENGIPLVKITDESEGQRVKSDESVRRLPLHPDLIRLGLLEYVEERRRAKAAQLFDVRLDGAGGVGNAMGKAFGYYIKTIVSLTPKKYNGEIGMHSFRKSLTQLLKSKETTASPGKRLQFMGRENKQGVKNVNETEDDFYANDYTVAELVDVNNAIDWSDRLGLDVDALRALLINQPVKERKSAPQRSAYAEQRAKERAAEAKTRIMGLAGKKK